MNQDQFIHYLIGFVDGEGCFCISVKKQKSAKMRWVLDPIFHVTQHSKHKEILYEIQKIMNCGIVIKKYGQENTMQFVVQNRKDLVNKIIPFFRKYPLIVKARDFEIFAEVVRRMVGTLLAGSYDPYRCNLAAMACCCVASRVFQHEEGSALYLALMELGESLWRLGAMDTEATRLAVARGVARMGEG